MIIKNIYERFFNKKIMKEVILASNNKGKIKEFKIIFAKFDIKILAQAEFDVPEIKETGLSFIENAILKARNCCKHTKLPSISDDSGLEVFALDGRPGIHSARFAKEHSNDTTNIIKLLDELKNSENRHARFVCTLAYLKHEKDPTPIIASGELKGIITNNIKGDNGFGYDPIFLVPKLNKTLSEISKEQKNKISHRAQALQNLFKQFKY